MGASKGYIIFWFNVKILNRTIGAFIVTISFGLWFKKGFVDFAVLSRGPLVCVGCDSNNFAFECAVGPIDLWIGSI